MGGGGGFPACITDHMTRGVCIGGCLHQGEFCIGGGADPPEHYRIRSISGRYASYRNAFLLSVTFTYIEKRKQTLVLLILLYHSEWSHPMYIDANDQSHRDDEVNES